MHGEAYFSVFQGVPAPADGFARAQRITGIVLVLTTRYVLMYTRSFKACIPAVGYNATGVLIRGNTLFSPMLYIAVLKKPRH